MPRIYTGMPNLFSNSQALNYVFIPGEISSLEVVQQSSALANQLQQTTTRVVVFFMDLEMLSEFPNTFAQQCDLDLGRTRIGFMLLELADDLILLVSFQCHLYVKSSIVTLLVYSEMCKGVTLTELTCQVQHAR
jgi:hypothetical protein